VSLTDISKHAESAERWNYLPIHNHLTPGSWARTSERGGRIFPPRRYYGIPIKAYGLRRHVIRQYDITCRVEARSPDLPQVQDEARQDGVAFNRLRTL
jgi:hypothetical protein